MARSHCPSPAVAFLAISPWSQDGYVNSHVFNHTSVIRFIEKRFGVYEKNLTPWRRAVMGDLTTAFNFANPNDAPVKLPSTASYLPSVEELSGGPTTTFNPTLSSVILGIPEQEKGIRPARALPCELNVHGSVKMSNSEIGLKFLNTGKAAVAIDGKTVRRSDAPRIRKILVRFNGVSANFVSRVYRPDTTAFRIRLWAGLLSFTIKIHRETRVSK